MKITTVGVDLAKDVIQVCVYANKNEALAIDQASLLPDIGFIKGKTAEQKQLQSILRLRELAVRHKTASGNQFKALWIQELVTRRGKKVAAVALANRTVRTAFSMLIHGTEYKVELLVA